MAIKELSDLNPDGTRMGQTTADKLGFYGLSVPIAQRSSGAMAALTMTATLSSVNIGFATSAKFNEFVDQVQEMRDTLVALGLHSGAS
jgi:hypothetical protein